MRFGLVGYEGVLLFLQSFFLEKVSLSAALLSPTVRLQSSESITTCVSFEVELVAGISNTT